MAFSFEIKGFEKFKKNLSKIPEKKAALIEEKLIDFVTEVNMEQVRRAPIDTGALRQHTFWTRFGRLQFGLFSNMPYAAYVEFGTGGLVDVPKGLEDYAIKFKGRGIKKVNLPARPFFFPPFLSRRNELKTDVDHILNK